MSYGNRPGMDGISKAATAAPRHLGKGNPPSALPKRSTKNHAVASKGKIPMEVYAHAISRMQAKKATKSNPAVYEAQATTAVGTKHENPTPKAQRKELTKTYSKPVGNVVDTRSSLQKRKDRSARMA